MFWPRLGNEEGSPDEAAFEIMNSFASDYGWRVKTETALSPTGHAP
jgi:hypothetical protein